MTNKIEQFLDEKFGEVRAIKEGVNLFFVAQDVAKSLQYAKATDMSRNLDEDEKGKRTLRTLGGEQELTVINESGLYSAVLSITKRNKERYELAREFKRWITGEVIPTIRETGGYVEEDREDDFVGKYFSDFSDEMKASMVQELMRVNEGLKVKSNKWDQFLEAGSTYTFTEVAKMISTKASEEEGKEIKISNQKLTKYLREEGILSKNKSSKRFTNHPNQNYELYFDVISRQVNEELSKTQTRVKSRGVEFIYEKLAENDMFVS